jgi:hypothetical protein
MSEEIKEVIRQLEYDRDMCMFNPETGENEPMNEDCRKSAEALTFAINYLKAALPRTRPVFEEGDMIVHYKRFDYSAEVLREHPEFGLYRYLGTAYDCTNETTDLVIYRAEYGSKKLFVRSAGDFYSFVPIAGRFRFDKWEGK